MKGDKFGTVTLALALLVMLGLGVVGLASPGIVLGPLGVQLPSASALNEMRAQIGGMSLAVAFCYGYGIVKPVAKRLALGLLVVQMGGVVLARVVSIALDGMPTSAVFKPMSLETVLLLLGIVALVRQRPVETPR